MGEKKTIFTPEKLDEIVKNCMSVDKMANLPVQLKSKDIKDIKNFGKEVMINRATIGDDATAQWLETTIRVNNMMYQTYGKGGKNI